MDVPLPYQVVRGEQLHLSGSVYNQQADRITVPAAPHPALNYISHDAPSLLGAVCTNELVVAVPSSVLCATDGRPGAVSARVPGDDCRVALHPLHLELSVRRGSEQGVIHPAGPGAWRTHPDLRLENKAREQRHCGEEAPSGGLYTDKQSDIPPEMCQFAGRKVMET